jgi:hypothetical protein
MNPDQPYGVFLAIHPLPSPGFYGPADFLVAQSVVLRKSGSQPLREAYEGEELRAVSELNKPPVRRPFLAHAAPSGSHVTVPGELPRVRAHPYVCVNMTEFVCDASFQNMRRRRAKAVMDTDQVRVLLRSVVKQLTVRTPGNRQV